jgi:hypothetical protein
MRRFVYRQQRMQRLEYLEKAGVAGPSPAHVF